MRKAAVCIKARLPPASLAFIGQVSEHRTVKRSIHYFPIAHNSLCIAVKCPLFFCIFPRAFQSGESELRAIRK